MGSSASATRSRRSTAGAAAAQELFDRVRRQMPGLEWIDLATSYRSAPTVIETVNAVFRGLKSNPVFDGDNRDAASKGADLWSKGFRAAHDGEEKPHRFRLFPDCVACSRRGRRRGTRHYGTAARWIEQELAKRARRLRRSPDAKELRRRQNDRGTANARRSRQPGRGQSADRFDGRSDRAGGVAIRRSSWRFRRPLLRRSYATWSAIGINHRRR